MRLLVSILTRSSQGVFSGVLAMNNFMHKMGDAVKNDGKKGWLVSILELGAWFGVLCTGYLADKLSRKFAILLGKICTSTWRAA